MLASVRWKSQQEDRWQHQRDPAKGDRQVLWQTDRTQCHRRSRKKTNMKSKKISPPCQGDLTTLSKASLVRLVQGGEGRFLEKQDSRTRNTVPEEVY